MKRRRPNDPNKKAAAAQRKLAHAEGDIGLVLSGGGSRAAYQVGSLKALIPYIKRDPDKIRVVVGSSIGAINGLIFAACLKEGLSDAVGQLDSLWRERTFRNTFAGSPSGAFVRAIRMAVWQYMSPGPKPTDTAIFDPNI